MIGDKPGGRCRRGQRALGTSFGTSSETKMNEFFRYDIRSGLTETEVWTLASRVLPMFRWRRGDSEVQGPYVKGENSDSIMIDLWLGENPIAMTISFRNVPSGLANREDLK